MFQYHAYWLNTEQNYKEFSEPVLFELQNLNLFVTGLQNYAVFSSRN